MSFTAGTGGGGTFRAQPASAHSRIDKPNTGHLGRKFHIIMMLQRGGSAIPARPNRVERGHDFWKDFVYWVEHKA
jgi:hypothetical protein